MFYFSYPVHLWGFFFGFVSTRQHNACKVEHVKRLSSFSVSVIHIYTTSESVEATLRIRRLLLAGCMACMGEERLPKKAMLGEMIGGKSYLGGQE